MLTGETCEGCEHHDHHRHGSDITAERRPAPAHMVPTALLVALPQEQDLYLDGFKTMKSGSDRP